MSPNIQINVVKRNGQTEPLDIEKIKRTIAWSCGDLEINPLVLETKSHLYFQDGITTVDIQKTLIKTALNLITVEEPDWQFAAGRLFLMDLYKQARINRDSSNYGYGNFSEFFRMYVEEKQLYYTDFYDYYSKEDVQKAGDYIKPERDLQFNYTQISGIAKRYLLNPNKDVYELPQEMYMVVAMYLAIPEDKETRLDFAFQIYDAISTQKISLPTPTLLNARGNFPQLSSCFKMNIDDGLREIYHSVENIAQISKYGGGIGTYLGNLRSKGASIRGIDGVWGGVGRWIKVMNDTAVAVNQLGARAGSVSVTLDMWHRDIHEFLDLQTETGDIRNKSFDIFPSIAIPDLFMKRVQEGGNWTLFDPHEVKKVKDYRLQDYWGDEFEKRFAECEQDENLKLKETLPAKDLFKSFMKTVVETGMPYAFFRDTANRMNPNKHAGMIYSTQLCVEIQQNTSPAEFIEEETEDGTVVIKYKPGDLVTCNLASINCAQVRNETEMDEVFPVAMRLLDNVITLNFYPIEESRITAMKYRSVGLGFLGLAEYLATEGYVYDSEEARERVDELFERYAYHTLKASSDLANARGAYSLFEGSDWSKGELLGKDANWFTKHAKTDHDWDALIQKVQQNGTRFSYHMAPAPNTSTSLIMGTTASVLPIYKKFFVESNMMGTNITIAPKLSKQNFWLYKEYVNTELSDVIAMMERIYKWIDQSVSFEWMIDPEKVTPKDLYAYYMDTWERGIKTVYYVRSMSLTTKECVSCSG